MAILPLQALQDNYIWCLIDEKNHNMICVDPSEANPVIEYGKRNHLNLTHVLITHHHYDHIGGLEKLIDVYPDLIIYGPYDERIPLVNTVVRDEDLIHVGKYDFRILSIPGHTSSHISYFETTKHWLFCGDTLFSAGCGRVFDGTIEQLFNSLNLIKNLPEDTQIYCAHEYTRDNLRFAKSIEPENNIIDDYIKHLDSAAVSCSLPSKLALEKKINPFLRTDTDALKKYATLVGLNHLDELSLFKHLRRQKDQF